MSIRLYLVVLSFLLVSCGDGGGKGATDVGAGNPDAANRAEPPVPVADAGPDITVTKFSTVFLDASHSQHAESYAWEQITGPYIHLKNPQAENETIVIPAAGVYTFRLTVKKGEATASDEVKIRARDIPTITISSPQSRSAVTAAQTYTLAGRVSGNIIRIEAENRTNKSSFPAVLQANGLFSIPHVALEKGDNEILLRAYTNTNTVLETRRMMTRTSIPIIDPLHFSIRDVAVNKAQPVIARVSLDMASNDAAVALVELNPDGSVGHVITTLKDDGNVETGDEYRNDGEYSGVFSVEFKETQKKTYRARISGNVPEYSNTVSITAYPTHEPTAFDEALSVVGNLTENSDLAKSVVGTLEYEQAKDKLLAALTSAPQVDNANMLPDRQSITVEFRSGVKTGIVFAEKSLPYSPTQKDITSRAGEGQELTPSPAVPGSFKVVYFSPFYNEHCSVASSRTGRDLGFLVLHPYDYDPVTQLTNESATVASLKNQLQAGVLDFFTHGALMTIDGEQTSTLMAENATPELNRQYKDDLDAQRILTTTDVKVVTDCVSGERTSKVESRYLITPKFIEHYATSMPHSLVNIQACQTFDDHGKLVSAFLDKGALAVLGNTGATYGEYSSDLTGTILRDLQDGMQLADAVKHAREIWGQNSSIWWENTQTGKWGPEGSRAGTSELRIGGGRNGLALTLRKTQVSNGSFEEGLTAWVPQEHGAQKTVTAWTRTADDPKTTQDIAPVSRIETTRPTEGQHMLMLATVGGEYAGVSQRLHISPGATYLAVDFKLIHEITEEEGVDVKVVPWKNQQFTVALETEDGTTHLLESIVGADPRLAPWQPWFEHTKCGRISDNVYSTNANAPLCASIASKQMSEKYDITAFRNHFVKLKILLKDDLSKALRLSDVQDTYALVDAVHLLNGNSSANP